MPHLHRAQRLTDSLAALRLNLKFGLTLSRHPQNVPLTKIMHGSAMR
jgi:hypothetical protein